MSELLTLRPARMDDALDVLAWRNDPATRAASRAGDEIDEASHLAWFERALADPHRSILIGEAGGRKVGMVRFDHGAETEVSINLNPDCRGRGLSYPLLTAALAATAGDVWAEVREGNAISRRLFERAGFEPQGRREEFWRYLRRGA